MNVPNLLTVSIVVPVYRGEGTLRSLVKEILPLTSAQTTPEGRQFVVSEVFFVHDCGPDQSHAVIEALAGEYAFVRPVWLSRNYGQHAATMAGMASSTGAWIVTLDEDGQQNPADIAAMLDFGIKSSLQVVYAKPINPPPHGLLRNFFSLAAKKISTSILGNRLIGRFNSFRLVDGEIARTLAAYCGHGVYLDVALFWIAGRIGHLPIHLRDEMDRPSSYSYRRLFAHFWNLVMTTGTRPLRLITVAGGVSVLLALSLAGYAIIEKLTGQVQVQGWTSIVIAIAFFSGSILMALGVIAEYLAVTMGIAMGKPLYVVNSKPTRPPIQK